MACCRERTGMFVISFQSSGFLPFGTFRSRAYSTVSSRLPLSLNAFAYLVTFLVLFRPRVMDVYPSDTNSDL